MGSSPPPLLLPMMIKRNSGFTLVELMIAAYLLLVGICGVILLFINSMSSTESSWDTTTAVTTAENVLEEMQNKNSLTEIVETDWNAWANTNNLLSLPQQEIKTVYGDLADNPLSINVIVSWQRKNGIKTISLETKLAR